jgi:CDP-glucose 4,6-dehydratase
MDWGIANRVQTYVGDIACEEALEHALRNFNPDWVFHLAACSIVARAQEQAFEAVETNIKGTYNLVHLSSKLSNVRGIIIASSDKAYGASPRLPYTENMPLLGGSIYDSSKACAELIAKSLALRLNLSLLITRCANVYGPGDLHFSRIVPDTIRSILRGRRPVIRGSGLQERSFIYIDDAISGYLKIAEYMVKKRLYGEAFNFGTGTSIRILDLVRMILDISGSDIREPTILGQDNQIEIDKQCVNADKARDLLGWRPEISLQAGLKTTIDWYRDRFNHRNDNEEAE